ncbi:Uncharacterised protein [uncultured archaeon]|nr:Uncharacterised protein [uncultured archaeon]
MPEDKWGEDKIKSFLGKQSEVEIRVAKALEELEHPFSIMVLVEPKNYTFIKNTIISKFSATDESIIYISLNNGYQRLVADLTKEMKNIENVYFIDMVSANSGGKIVNAPNVDYLNSPSDLTECILVLEKKLESSGNKKVIIVLDSVTTVAVYNESAAVEKFVHVLVGKANTFNASAILLSPDYEENKSLTETIEQFMDKTVKI